jgi:hypothetical protein
MGCELGAGRVVKDAKGHPIKGADIRIETKNGGKFATTVRSCLVRVTSNSKKQASPMVSSNKIMARPKIFAAMVCRNGIGISQESHERVPTGKPKSMRTTKRFHGGTCANNCGIHFRRSQIRLNS